MQMIISKCCFELHTEKHTNQIRTRCPQPEPNSRSTCRIGKSASLPRLKAYCANLRVFVKIHLLH